MMIENPCYHCYAGAVGGYCLTCDESKKISNYGDVESFYIEVEDTEDNNGLV